MSRYWPRNEAHICNASFRLECAWNIRKFAYQVTERTETFERLRLSENFKTSTYFHITYNHPTLHNYKNTDYKLGLPQKTLTKRQEMKLKGVWSCTSCPQPTFRCIRKQNVHKTIKENRTKKQKREGKRKRLGMQLSSFHQLLRLTLWLLRWAPV